MISVIIPNFNDFRIERTLESILAQTTANYEVIIQEGCEDYSETRSLYDFYGADSRISVFAEKDDGIFDAFNRGIERAKGDYVFLIGSDDYLLDVNTFQLVEKSIKDFGSDVISIGCKMFKGGSLVRKWEVVNTGTKGILMGDMPPHLGLFVSKGVYDKIGLFEWQSMYDGCDSLWLLKLAVKVPEASFSTLKKVFMAMEIGGHSTGSLKNILRANVNLYKYASELGVRAPLLLVLNKLRIKILQIL